MMISYRKNKNGGCIKNEIIPWRIEYLKTLSDRNLNKKRLSQKSETTSFCVTDISSLINRFERIIT